MGHLWDLERHGDRIAVITSKDQIFTYKELGETQLKLANKLKERTIAIICCKNTIGSLLSYLSCMKKRVVPLLLPMDIKDEKLNTIIESYKPEYLCIPDDRVFIGKEFKKLAKVQDYNILSIKQTEQLKLYQDLALLLTTSGSTGNTKCVRLSNKNIVKNTESICEYLNITEEDRAITSLPMNYAYGLSIIHTHLSMGAVLLLTECNTIQKIFWDFFRKYKGTVFSGVPYTYECLYKFQILKNDYPSLKALTQAGGKLRPELQKYYADLALHKNIRFYIMYGQTEATARISYLPYGLAGTKLGSAGVSIPGGKISIINDEVVYQGENVCLGYSHNRDDLVKGDCNKGILYTGDLGYMENNLLYITGRKSREIKINGRRTNLDDVVELLKRYSVGDVYCIYKDDRLYIFHDDLLQSDYLIELLDTLSISKKDIIELPIKQVPRNAYHKIDFKKLKTYM